MSGSARRRKGSRKSRKSHPQGSPGCLENAETAAWLYSPGRPGFPGLAEQHLKTAKALFAYRALSFLAACTHCLQAGPIPKLFNTGVDDTGALLAESQGDSHYTIAASPDPNFPGPDAFTLEPGYPVGPWIEEGPNSRWIAPQANQRTGNAPGVYTFGTTFDLTGLDPASAQISGRTSADNSIVAVRLNANDLGIMAGG